MLRFKALKFSKLGAKRGAPVRAKTGHPGRATAKVKGSIKEWFFGRFFAPSKTLPKWAVGRFSASYNIATSGAPTETTFLGRPPAFG
jgi:hypothetical protein